MLRRAAAIVAVSPTVAGSIAAGLPDVADRIHTIPNGADPSRFEVGPSPELRRRLGLDSSPVLLYLGRVVPEKGCDDLIRAVAALSEPRPRVLIVGPGAHGAELAALAATLGVGMVHVPGVEHEAIPDYLALADVFVLPSRHQEGMPFTLVEAMLAARPVIATAIGGVPDMLFDGVSALLVAPGDVPALSGAVRRLLADGPLRRRLAAAARDEARGRYSLDTMIDAIEGLLRRVASTRSACA
jgi:glycosyltransferase involved in cell wall biosynthesis